MPTPDEKPLVVPSLGVESDALNQPPMEGGESGAFIEGGSVSESPVSNRPVDTLLGEASPSAAVELNLKFRNSMQPIPRGEGSPEGDDAESSQEIQRIKDNAQMEGIVVADPQQFENSTLDQDAAAIGAAEEFNKNSAEADYSSNPASEVTPSPEHNAQLASPPHQSPDSVASGSHNHSEHMAADHDALDNHDHLKVMESQADFAAKEDVPSDPESAGYANSLHADFEAGQLKAMNRLQQAA